MKKLLFAAYDMGIGGIETSLRTLLNELADRGYDITLVLEKKEGIFLSELDSKIKVIQYTPSEYKVVPIRKIINLGKRIGFLLRYYHRFDFAASYATYSLMSAFVVRNASKNNVLWGHADYLALFHEDQQKFKQFFEQLQYEKFGKILFVSRAACESFLSIYPQMEQRIQYCNNLVNYQRIEELANKEIDLKKEDCYTFLNIGRHDERQKQLSKLIEAARILKGEGRKFRILLIGEGPDTKRYKEMVEGYQLNDVILFCGMKKNPYPYFKLADSVILTSDYEGYPVVYLEAFVLKKPILTTDVSDAQTQVENRFGKVMKKEVNEIYQAMKEFMVNGFTIKEEFDAKKYNAQIIEELEKIF